MPGNGSVHVSRRARDLFGSGRFWMAFWLGVLTVMTAWAVLTALFWLDSVRNLNALSIAAVLLAPAAGFQATLGMRKADPEDPL
jgi:uncharacterized membrane protein YeiB